ncbi:hypothetical protein F4810DRAFT_568944 [Camillea tinctor]|nr:hypothetical protein F4810DRAFT_568944 [Camillea tinctor]
MATGSEVVALSAAGERQHDQPAKFSRYRSLRGKSASTTPNTVNPMSHSDSHEVCQQQDATSGNSIARSMSRYRRRANSVAANDNATQNLNSDPPSNGNGEVPPPVPAIPRPLRTIDLGGHQQNQDDGPGTPGTPLTSPRTHPRHTDSTSKHRRRMSGFQNRPSTAVDENQRRGTADRNERPGRLNEEEEAARLEAETDRMIAEQKKKDLQRLEIQLANSPRASAFSHKTRSPVIEKFVLLAKGRKSKDVLSPATPTSGGNDWKAHATHPDHAKAHPTGIQPGGRGIVPQTDAPTSAINAGDRNVTVRCRHHTFSLEVTPETTPIDILSQTAQQMTYDLEITPANCVVVEAYGALGLERRLRRYERIRDVMNSWDRDAQNQLVVTVSESAEEDHDLDVSGVPSGEAPQGVQLYMYHSNRPGKWNKRWITLLQNGQIFCAKKPNAHTSDKDATNLCRLSDYDIYTPTDSQMRRHLKPPKRYAFAIRSQQKTTVFLNTENYVHYFSTEDPKVAAEFKEKVQGWRSWYLLDRRPEARRTRKVSIPKTEEAPPQITSAKHTPKKPSSVAAVDGHQTRVSVDESPYSIGQFEPLLDMKRFDKRLSQFGKDAAPGGTDTSAMPKGSTTSRSSRPSKEGKPNLSLKLVDTIKSASEDAFTGGGLLGEGYEERKQAQAEAERMGGGSRGDAAFTDGPSLLNKQSAPASPIQKPESPSWFPSAIEHSAKQRSTSSSSRPSTSAGAMPTRRQSLSSRPPPPPLPASSLINGAGNNNNRPATQHGHPHPLSSQPIRRGDRSKPLIDLTPTFQEPPQWSKEGKGHGVKAPEGMAHLVDLISVGGAPGKHLEVPSRSAILRRPGTSSQGSSSATLARTRSKSAGAPPPLKGAAGAGEPPVPPVPGRLIDGAGGNEERGRVRGREGRANMNGGSVPASNTTARERERERERAKSKAREREQREREYRERERAYNRVPGRTGTLKTV